jgi:hypothetical protein
VLADIATQLLATITVSGLVSVAVFVIGTWIVARINAGVQHGYDTKLEALRAQLQRDHEATRDAIKTRDDQLAALRSGALANMAARHTSLDKRRLQAIEKVWREVTRQAPLKNCRQKYGCSQGR